jgi:ribosomal protein S18 acetylase RimI-like enzyme
MQRRRELEQCGYASQAEAGEDSWSKVWMERRRETDNYQNTAMRLYESVGFQVIREVLVYRKDYNDTAI